MRSSPPIHTCSEHAQGPSKPPAVVRKPWRLNMCCALDDLASPAKPHLWNQGWGEGGVGSEEVKCLCHLVTLRFQGLFVEGRGYWRGVAYLNRAWPSFSGKHFPLAARESLQVSKVKCREMTEYWMLCYYNSGHSWRTPSTWPMHLHLRSFFFFFWWLASDSFFLAYLDDFAIKMCSPNVNAECLAKSEKFEGDLSSDPLLVPLHLRLMSWFCGTMINTTSKSLVLTVVFTFTHQKDWSQHSIPLLRILWYLPQLQISKS